MSNETLKAIEMLAAQYKTANAEKKALEAQLADLKEQIVSLMGDEEKVKAGIYKVSNAKFDSLRFAEKALKEADPDTWYKYVEVKPMTRFTVA